MSWASERLLFLNERYSYREISTETGIPTSTISYVIRDVRTLPSQYILDLRNFYTRTAYAALRQAGFSVDLARTYRWYAPAQVTSLIEKASSVVEMLAQDRLATYREYLQSMGTYESDEATLDILRESIARGLTKYHYDPEDESTGKDSPSIRHVFGLD